MQQKPQKAHLLLLLAIIQLAAVNPFSRAETLGGKAGLVQAKSLGWDAPIEFGEPKSSPSALHHTASATTPGFSPAIAMAVGGILFMETAQPADGFPADSLAVYYDTTAPDGKRLRVALLKDTLFADVHDWVLLPVIRYVESGDHSCFTLFGHLSDTAEERRLLKAGKKILNYHPAFDNTLLGLRLMQMDILILRAPLTGALPRDGDGEFILGTGESAPSRKQALMATKRFRTRLDGIRGRFRSYVITDKGRTITFGRQGDSLKIRGNLRYWFWKSTWNPIANRALADTNFQRIQMNANAMLNNRLRTLPTDSARKAWLLDTLLTMARRHEREMPKREVQSPLLLRLESISSDSCRQFIDSLGLQDRYRLAVTLATVAEWCSIEELTELEELLDDNRDVVRALNPSVWDAAETTMRLAAFLRYVKTHHPESWQGLARTASRHRANPAVATPHILNDDGINRGGSR